MKAARKETSIVEFSLIYSGELSSKKKGDLSQIQEIRRALHPQLADLWKTHGGLLSIANREKDPNTGLSGLQTIMNKFTRGDFHFVPLVTEDRCLLCHIDIQFFRRENPGHLITKPRDEYGGDLDNRVKTFMDGLRVPNVFEILGSDSPKDDEEPFYCLLQDDSLISRLAVESRQWLGPNKGKANEAMLIVKVTVKATHGTLGNISLV